MKISTTSPQPPLNPQPKPNPASETPPPPQDGFFQSVGRQSQQTAVRWGESTGLATGGATALAFSGAGLYAGVLGGAAFGTALGLGAGPMVASLGSSGALDFLGTTFGTAGKVAQAGILLGGATVAAGSLSLGYQAGNLAGKIAGAVPGAAVGAFEGAWNSAKGQPTQPLPPSPPQVPTPPTELSLPAKALAVGLGGTGIITGGVGGAMLGAGVSSANSLVQGLLAQNLTWSAVTGAALVGTAIGAGAGALIGGRGGLVLAEGAQKAGDWLGQRLVKSEGPSINPDDVNQVGDKAKEAGSGLLNFSKQLSATQIGLNLADSGASLGYVVGAGGSAASGLGYGMSALHGLRSVSNLIGAANESDGRSRSDVIQHRLSLAAGDALLAGGHIVGAAGGGAWSLPLMGAGMVLNTVSDYRHSSKYGA